MKRVGRRLYSAPELAKFVGIIGLCILPLSREAIAAQPDTATIQEVLAAAEKAYQEVDFAAVYDSACRGLEKGHADVASTSRLSVLCGISAAALEKHEEAKRNFVLALAVRQELQLERELSPKIRGPYLEAQGFWGAQSERLTLRLISRDSAKQILVRVHDPANLASRVEFYSRLLGQSKFQLTTLSSANAASVPLSEVYFQNGYEYYARLTDAHENALVSVGNELEPIEVGPIRELQTQGSVAYTTSERSQEKSSSQGRSLWLPVTLILSGAALSAAGVYFNVRRENAAHQWNSSACQQPGLTRIEQCGDVNTERTHFERAAIGFYTAGGLFFVSGLAAFALGNNSDARNQRAGIMRKSFDCATGLTTAHIVCQGEF
jgi:hypothetical protein